MSIEAMKQALNKAFQLGQRYWSLADSEYSSHWKKADAAKAEFDKLVEDTLRTAIEQAEKPKYDPIELHVLHSHIAGVLFDFMGWLTSREKRLTLSSTDEAGPAVEAITEFAKMRGLNLHDAQVEHWQAILTTQPAAPVQEPNEADELLRHLGLDPQTYRTDGGAINRMKVKAALAHPDEYPRMGSMDAMVNRFLTWPVPASVYPDGTPGQPGRTGTNLLTADEARQMLEHVVGTPPAAQRQWVGLTREEILNLGAGIVDFEYAATIEAKLREKNGGNHV